MEREVTFAKSNRQMEKAAAEREAFLTARRGQIMELESDIADSEPVPTALRTQIKELDSNMRKLECSLRDARKCREKDLRVESAHYSGNEGPQIGLQERNRDITEREATLHCRRCEELSMALTELRLQRESDNRRITELENRVREEAATGNEGLQNRLQETNKDIKKREATHHCRRCEELSMALTELRLQRESDHRRIKELENRLREEAVQGMKECRIGCKKGTGT
jgi:hypothetical protein